MILQALYEYYQRKAADPNSKIAPEGWEWKEIPFLVVIDKEGNFLRFEDTREGEGRNRRARRFLVPQGETRTVGIKPFLLWDNVEYVLGANPRKRDDITERHGAFKEKIETLILKYPDFTEIGAVRKFLNSKPIDQIEKKQAELEKWREILESNAFITFKLDQSDYQTICEFLPKTTDGVQPVCDRGVCLVNGGKNVKIEHKHPFIKGVRGTKTSGAAIVSFNLPAFVSYAKQQNYNAPICTSATFAYATALNTLLSKDSQNKISISDATIVFWAQKKPKTEYDFESDFAWYFKNDKDDPDRGVNAVKGLYNAVQSGKLPMDEGARFYVLALAPNAARISVRFWKTGTIKEFAEKIKRHFDDFRIVHGPKEPEHLSLYQILSATALEYKMDNVPPNLAGKVIESFLDGSPYPITLLHQCVRRIRAEQNVNRTRAAILKAYLNRFNRFYKNQEKEVQMALDIENKDVGYLLGRLFAILEKAQIQSAGGEGKINTTIRDRFFGAFSTSPTTVIPTLLKLKNHHISKLEKGKGYFELLIGQVMNDVDAQKIPAHLTLGQQTHLAVGYYHQRQDFFRKREIMS